MTQSKKLGFIFTLVVILPILLTFLNASLGNRSKLSWNYQYQNSINLIASLIAFVGDSYLLIANAKQGKSTLWFILGGLSLLYILGSFFIMSFGFEVL
ncbi:MAG: hypothetical protein A2722_03365 [Candidatus Doudnabacteria bacterium RIFCSPHIGHO2_01_FULL_50_11]|uniref:Uncharacterized protein n=1 Tax=Candidatus Doudnabacteria bacterium RIFCSPHIGHO2_01_FULL_50_11 TaxID=1817828 RepID=A0A1F5PIK2_9BACT|nr:MAG: hypothetical protein A2722_03365 [Candidatus Doudnabacteria bacterium RIFCSPHIGHO2_01_FULL_50_11]